MIVTTHQPVFLPWPGLFHKARQADAMVLLDAVQFPQGRGWMTRNRLKGDQGELWLTVPVWKRGRGKQVIREVDICETMDWRRKHLQALRQNYVHAPYAGEYLPAVEAIYGLGHGRLIDLNLALIRLLWDAFGLKTRLLLQSELDVQGTGTDLLVAVCRKLGADAYATLPIVEKYLDAERFRGSGVELVYAPYAPPVYPQLWGDFRYNLSALDLLFTCGPDKGQEILARAGRRPAPEAAGAAPAPGPDDPDSPPGEVFVFGSDLAGRHSGGDALTALRRHGAVYGRGVGLQGRSYAIPVRDEQGRPLPIQVIARYVQAFLRFADIYRQTTFHVTRLGCERGAYRDEQIAPLFAGAPANCRLPKGWQRYLPAGKG